MTYLLRSPGGLATVDEWSPAVDRDLAPGMPAPGGRIGLWHGDRGDYGLGEADLATRTARFLSHRVDRMVAVGVTGPHWVRIWFRTDMPGEHAVQVFDVAGADRSIDVNILPGAPGDMTAAVTYPAVAAHPPLVPLRRYRYRVVRTRDGTPLGEGTFETTPARDADTPGRVVVGVMSCHQPFTNDGTLIPESARMLALLPHILREQEVKFVLGCGDQIYADHPGQLSLFNNPHLIAHSVPGKTSIFDCTAAEVRRLYDRRYRTFWSMIPWRKMAADFPCYPAMDDHEIDDDWGSLARHATPRYANIRDGARAAFLDYQASRVLPPRAGLPVEFHYHFNYGNIGVFVMDLRSQRRRAPRGQIFSDVQFNDFRRFLRASGSKRVVLVVCSVPVIHLPGWLTDLGHRITGDKVDFLDQWSHGPNRPSRDRFLTLLHEHQQTHPRQRVVLVSGDVHVGCVFAINWRGGSKPRLHQFTSSPITNLLRGWQADLSRVGPQLVSGIDTPPTRDGRGGSGWVRLTGGASDGVSANPLAALHLGLIEIQRDGAEANLRFKLVSHNAGSPLRPVIRFESGWLN